MLATIGAKLGGKRSTLPRAAGCCPPDCSLGFGGTRVFGSHLEGLYRETSQRQGNHRRLPLTPPPAGCTPTLKACPVGASRMIHPGASVGATAGGAPVGTTLREGTPELKEVGNAVGNSTLEGPSAAAVEKSA